MDELTHRLLAASSELACERDTKAVLDKLSEVARELLNAEICSIFLHDAEKGELWSYIKQRAHREIRFPETKGIAGYALRTQGPLIVNNPYNDPHFNPDVDREMGYESRCIMALPLTDRKGKSLGVVEAINKRGGDGFAAEDLAQLQSVGLYINGFVENIVLYKRVEQTQEAIIHKLSRASRFKDRETYNHTFRVGRYSGLIAESIGFGPDAVRQVVLAAPMHDVGKVGIPDAIIGKKGKLTEEEYRTTQEHTTFGYEILAGGDSDLTEQAAIMALEHHERWDGTGYPNGKRGEDIRLVARIVSVADVFDVMCSRRTYKEPRPFEEALDELERCKNTQFDPHLVNCFLKGQQAIKDIMRTFADELPSQR